MTTTAMATSSSPYSMAEAPSSGSVTKWFTIRDLCRSDQPPSTGGSSQVSPAGPPAMPVQVSVNASSTQRPRVNTTTMMTAAIAATSRPYSTPEAPSSPPRRRLTTLPTALTTQGVINLLKYTTGMRPTSTRGLKQTCRAEPDL